jgi:hypothetical protein
MSDGARDFPSDGDPTEGAIVYPDVEGLTLARFSCVGSIVVSFIAGFAAMAAVPASGVWWRIVLVIVCAYVGGALLGYVAVRAWAKLVLRRLRVRPVPLFRLDACGVECAKGRFAWDWVTGVLQVVADPPRETRQTAGGSSRIGASELWFKLRPGTRRLSTSNAYFNHPLFLGRVKLSESMLIIKPVSAGRVAAVMRFYDGPVAAVRKSAVDNLLGELGAQVGAPPGVLLSPVRDARPGEPTSSISEGTASSESSTRRRDHSARGRPPPKRLEVAPLGYRITVALTWQLLSWLAAFAIAGFVLLLRSCAPATPALVTTRPCPVLTNREARQVVPHARLVQNILNMYCGFKDQQRSSRVLYHLVVNDASSDPLDMPVPITASNLRFAEQTCASDRSDYGVVHRISRLEPVPGLGRNSYAEEYIDEQHDRNEFVGWVEGARCVEISAWGNEATRVSSFAKFLGLARLVATRVPATRGMTVTLGAPHLSGRGWIAEPITVACSPFDTSLILHSEHMNVTVVQVSAQSSAHGSANVSGSIPTSLFRCDNSPHTVVVHVGAASAGRPFHGGAAVFRAFSSAEAGAVCFPGSTTCFTNNTVQSGSAGPTTLHLQ